MNIGLSPIRFSYFNIILPILGIFLLWAGVKLVDIKKLEESPLSRFKITTNQAIVIMLLFILMLVTTVLLIVYYTFDSTDFS